MAALIACAPASAAPPAPRSSATPPSANPCVAPDVTNFLAADATRPGVISLYFFGAQGAPVTYFECVRGRAQRLGSKTTPDGSPTLLRDATTWSCDRLTRRFVATAPRPDATQVLGTYSVRTMSCARRLRLSAPRRVARGATLRIRVADSWGIGGIRPTLCVTLPGGARRCSVIAFPRAVAVASRRVRANARGRVRLELRVRDRRVGNAAVAVGVGVERQAALPKVLTTGDSMMQGIDGFLADDLGDGAEVHSDVRPGTSIGKNLDWLRWSASQVRRLHPATTVVAIGPNEGWPQQTPAGARVECCGEPWETELSRRMGIMIATYLRRGRGHVIWLTLPAPRGGRLTPIFDAVNHAILRAGTGVPGVTILRMDQLFSPDGYRDAMRYRGVVVRVREPDGVHLNVAGTAIAATQIAQAIAAWR